MLLPLLLNNVGAPRMSKMMLLGIGSYLAPLLLTSYSMAKLFFEKVL